MSRASATSACPTELPDSEGGSSASVTKQSVSCCVCLCVPLSLSLGLSHCLPVRSTVDQFVKRRVDCVSHFGRGTMAAPAAAAAAAASKHIAIVPPPLPFPHSLCLSPCGSLSLVTSRLDSLDWVACLRFCF